MSLIKSFSHSRERGCLRICTEIWKAGWIDFASPSRFRFTAGWARVVERHQSLGGRWMYSWGRSTLACSLDCSLAVVWNLTVHESAMCYGRKLQRFTTLVDTATSEWTCGVLGLSNFHSWPCVKLPTLSWKSCCSSPQSSLRIYD